MNSPAVHHGVMKKQVVVALVTSAFNGSIRVDARKNGALNHLPLHFMREMAIEIGGSAAVGSIS